MVQLNFKRLLNTPLGVTLISIMLGFGLACLFRKVCTDGRCIHFRGAVIDAIQRHVDAKRYLCAARPEYYESLSEDSKRSLKLQGGIFSKAEADQFIAEPGAPDAVRLRLWDDLAKQPTLETPGLAHYMQIARRCALKA